MGIRKAILVAVGIAAFLMALAGLWYNLVSVRAVAFSPHPGGYPPYFFAAYYTLWTICTVCYVALLGCGVQLIRQRAASSWALLGVVGCEVCLFFFVVFLWGAGLAFPALGTAVASATGVALGGLMFQFLTLFPVWAPAAAFWATRDTRLIAG